MSSLGNFGIRPLIVMGAVGDLARSLLRCTLPNLYTIVSELTLSRGVSSSCFLEDLPRTHRDHDACGRPASYLTRTLSSAPR